MNNTTTNALIESGVGFAYQLDLNNLPKSEEVILNNYDNIIDFGSLPLLCIDSTNDGDGNDLVTLYALLDKTNKFYTLFGFFGTYSSWSESDWESIEPVELKTIEMYIPKIAE